MLSPFPSASDVQDELTKHEKHYISNGVFSIMYFLID